MTFWLYNSFFRHCLCIVGCFVTSLDSILDANILLFPPTLGNCDHQKGPQIPNMDLGIKIIGLSLTSSKTHWLSNILCLPMLFRQNFYFTLILNIIFSFKMLWLITYFIRGKNNQILKVLEVDIWGLNRESCGAIDYNLCSKSKIMDPPMNIFYTYHPGVWIFKVFLDYLDNQFEGTGRSGRGR